MKVSKFEMEIRRKVLGRKKFPNLKTGTGGVSSQSQEKKPTENPGRFGESEMEKSESFDVVFFLFPPDVKAESFGPK